MPPLSECKLTCLSCADSVTWGLVVKLILDEQSCLTEGIFHGLFGIVLTEDHMFGILAMRINASCINPSPTGLVLEKRWDR